MFKVVKKFKYPIVVLAALSTIVLGLELGTCMIVYQKNIALVLGAIITGLTTMMTFWNVEEYWLKSKVIELQLISLKNSFEFEKRAGIDEDRLKEFFKQYQSIVGQQEELWRASLDENK